MSQCHDNYEDRRGDSFHLPIRVKDLMTPDPAVVDPTSTVKDIAEVMIRRNVRMVPVVDIGGQFVGVVSEADLICRSGHPGVRRRLLSPLVGSSPKREATWFSREGKALTAEELMTRDVVTCESEEPVKVVVRRMLGRNIRTVPVIEDGRLVGVLSRHDVLRVFVRPDREIRQRIAQLLDTPVWPPGHTGSVEVLDGVVKLTGTLPQVIDAAVLCSIVGDIPGVIEVVDRLVADVDLNKNALNASYE